MVENGFYRNLNPSNIVRRKNRSLRVIDLGRAIDMIGIKIQWSHGIM